MKSKFLLICFLIPYIAISQILQIGADIDGEASSDESGISVNLSSDGNIIAIGAPNNQGNGFKSGHVRVYQNSEGVWTQVGEDIDGESIFDYLGFSVSLSADGSTVASGAPFKLVNGVQTGHVPIFRNIGGSWVQIGEPILGEAEGDYWGGSVDLNEDGNIVAIGGHLNDGNGSDSGHVRVYQNTGDFWVQVGSDIDGDAASDNFGWSVSLNAEGNILAVGAISNDDNGLDSGHVRIFRNNGGDWEQIGQDIGGEAPSNASGYSVDLSANGSIVAIGAPFNQGNGTGSGHVRIYQNIGDNWNQLGSDIDGEAAGDASGSSVSLNSNGTIVAIGAQGNDGNGMSSGHVRLYQYNGNEWIWFNEDIEGEAENDFSGLAVSLNAEGRIVAVGAPFNDENGAESGHVRVFNVTDVLGLGGNSKVDFSIYPSPTSGVVSVLSETAVDKLEVYNQLGQKIFSLSGKNKIDLTNESSGLYFIKLTDLYGKSGIRKVVKK